MIETTQRVETNTPAVINQRFEERLRENIARYGHADRQAIDRRLSELDREWNTERLIETEAPLMIGLGIALGLTHHRRWFGISALAAGMVIFHNLQGWRPPLAVLRRLGFRTAKEINEERFALKSLRGDFDRAGASDVDGLVAAVKA